MMRIGEQSASDDSQPSLVVENVLRRHTPVTKGASSTREACRPSTPSTFGANLRSAAPQYHFHGLAATQTDSQLEDSQLPPGLDNPPRTSVSPEKNRSKSNNDPVDFSRQIGNETRRSLSPDSTRVKRGRDDVKRTSRYAPHRQTSLSPVSQDSFAEPLPPVDRARLYAGDSRPFNIPANRLDDSQDSAGSDNVMSSIFSPANRSQSIEPPNGQPSDSQSYGLNDDSIYGNMAFAQAQDIDEVPPNYVPPRRVHSPTSEHSSSAPSSSYYRLIDGHRDDDTNRHTPDVQSFQESQPTQPSTPVATQPTSDEPSQPSAYRDNPVFKSDAPPVQAAASIMTGTSTTTGRGLLGLVDPAKRWRVQTYLKQQDTITADTQPNTSAVATFGDTIMEETQMVDERPGTPVMEETQISEESQPMVETQPTEETQPSEEPSMYPRRQLPPAQPSAVSSTPMEVIPDSEPDDVAPPPRSSPRTPVTETRTKFRALSVSTVSEGDCSTIPGLAVPDNIPSSSALRQEVEESSDDEDTPLVVTTGIKPVSKAGKPSSSKVTQVPAVAMPPPQTTGRSAAATRVRRLPKKSTEEVHNRSWDTTVVPSSEPNESVAQPPVVPAPVPVAEVVKQNSKPPSRPRSTRKIIGSASTLSSVTPTRRFPTHSTVETDIESVNSDEVIPPPSDTADQITENGDEDAMDIESDLEAQNTRSRKRRRVASAAKVKKEPKSGTKRKASPTPSRAPKRIKSEPNTTQATRVFALWRAENVYYSGVVHEISKTSSKRFLIKFDDGDQEWTSLSKMRRCQLNPGDHVLFENGEMGTVVEYGGDDPDDYTTFELNDGTTRRVKMSGVRVAGRSLLSQWDDRVLDIDNIVPVIRPKSAKPSPAPSRMSVASVGSIKSIRSRVLGRTGFVVTICPGNNKGDQDKNKAMQSVKLSGGQVFDDWSNIFKMEGKTSQNGKRWVINDKDVITAKLDVDRVFLLADQFNHKPKFLMALALGIPCLSFKWLDACIREQQDVPWYPYLLPAGMSEILDARVSQFVDLDWGNSPAHLTDIMSYNVPPKVFRDKSLLCLSADYLPKMTKTKGLGAKESNALVPRILLCMGASRVEAVAEVRNTSHSLEKYDYVIVKEEKDVGPLRSQRAKCVHFGWVKECLVAGRILDYDWE